MFWQNGWLPRMRIQEIGIMILVLFLFQVCLFSHKAYSQQRLSQEWVITKESFANDEGKIIQSIQIYGLERTSEKAVRYLLGQKEKEKFDAGKWFFGITKLYNTGVLYDIQTEIKQGSDPDSIQIEIFLHDKWTLIPYANGQGGGGLFTFGAGVFDRNLGGYFTNVSVGIAGFNGHLGYNFNLFQEWFLDTDYVLGLDFSKFIFPVIAQDRAGDVTQSFVWQREQQQLLLGRRIGTQIRFISMFDAFKDLTLMQSASTQAQVYNQYQYRVRPTLILGRSNLINYMEEGTELTFDPSFVNFLSSDRGYYQFLASYKMTRIIQKSWNFASFVRGGVMSLAPLPYQYRLGGFESIRGFDTFRFIGNLFIYGNFEIRPTLWSHRFDWSLLDWVVIQGSLFADVGWIRGSTSLTGTDSDSMTSLAMASVGVGIRLFFVRYSNAILRLDLAQTLSPAQGAGISFGIGQLF